MFASFCELEISRVLLVQRHTHALDSIISLGKYGSFPANQILGRPFHVTFEILDHTEIHDGRELRIVSAAELHADALIQQAESPNTSHDDAPISEEGDHDSAADKRTNRNLADDPSNQRLTMGEIEALKADGSGSSKEIISKILASHSTIDQKTTFSLAKYKVRKNKKYMRRFCVLPLDVLALTNWLMNERDFGKVMELRNEILGLIGSWANVHQAEGLDMETNLSGQYLVVDDTGGLVVAAMAERMGILYAAEDHNTTAEGDPAKNEEQSVAAAPPEHFRKGHHEIPAMSAQTNTITLLHSNSQSNLALLKYFSFDTNTPPPQHPLFTNLKTLSWLQLLSPDSDPAYTEPEIVTPETLASWKSSKRSGYYRKRRRWTRTKSVIDNTRQGGFHGLILATVTSPISILHHAVPLLAGAAQVVVYSPHVEPLAELADLYSTARRTAFLNTPEVQRTVPSQDFPLDPTLLLAPTVQTARLKRWQVLPGRTHPLMMGRGGAEGYIFVATRVLPAQGTVQARGRAGGKRRKVERPSDLLDVVGAALQADTCNHVD
jgi:tRNA (adenine58-N1)-methyltransferase non-catalytic subunit